MPSWCLPLKLGFSGKASSENMVYQRVIDGGVQALNKGRVFFSNGCFVAGTLVHTKEGLRPIEEIKVGDYVLSKLESGEGEQSYQRVVRTFVHEDQEVCCVDVNGWTPEERELAEATCTSLDESKGFPLVVTANHPFWVAGKGWVEAGDLQPGVDQILLADGSPRYIDDLSIVVRTSQTDIGWLVGGWHSDPDRHDGLSREMDFRNGVHTQYGRRNRVRNDAIQWFKKGNELKRTVYNLEVENTHTYYVGEQGVWVHDAHCK